jgi:ferredoxin-type protein NapG
MERREFFRLGARKAAEAVVRIADERAMHRARNWLRPPFARPEPEFLECCTRCDDCIAACPHDVIFKLPARYGIEVAGTPAMDLANRGCHLCEDWPCVTACEPHALSLPAPEPIEGAPRLANLQIDTDVCLPYSGPECGACADSCPVPGALEWQDGVRPHINQDICTGCALCREVCILTPKAITICVVTGEQS